MTRNRGGASKGLQRRAFGTAGRRGGSERAPRDCCHVMDLSVEILRGPTVVPATLAWKPRPGRVYNFPIRTVPEEK